MIKIYRKLTKEQKSRYVVFASTLSQYPTDNIEGLTTHEVTMYSPPSEQERTIARLKDDKFFDSSPFKYNIIRK